MSDEADTNWLAFLAESDEHLQAADELLTRGAASREDVASLFRAVHSLKGLAMAMDLANMLAVAHRAEDLLGIVREGRAALDGTATGTLLHVVDCLRSMRDWTQAHRADPPAEPEIIARLDAAVAQASGGSSPVLEAVAAAPSLSDDSDMLALYCELLSEMVPAFGEALVTGDGTPAADAAEALIVGAGVVGLDQVADVLRQAAAHAQTLPAPAGRSGLVLALAELQGQLVLLEEIAGSPAGAETLGLSLASHARTDMIARVGALRAVLEGGAAPGEATALATAARLAAGAACMPQAAGILLLVEEQLGRAAQAETMWSPAEAALARDLAAAVDGIDSDLDPAVAAAIRADWQARIVDGTPAAEGTRTATLLPPELRHGLTPAQSAELDQRVASGWHGYHLLLDTEGEPEIANDLTAWMSTNAAVITSSTVSAGGMSWFEFLFASPEPLDRLRATLAGLDPDNRCIRGLRQVSQASHQPAVGEPPPRSAEAMIRVRADAVDALLDRLDEMRVALGTMGETLTALRGDLTLPALAAADDIQSRMEAMHRRLRTACLELRVVPVDTVFARYPRIVREVAGRLGREVQFEIEGRDARIDKGMADQLIDPLMHLVRNAVDHGIEPPDERQRLGKPRQARLVLAASEHADGIHIAVRDDGRGLDRTAILARATERGLVAPGAQPPDREVFELLFRSGFSTAATVTEISGRGVGLDVVAHAVARLGGSIDIETVPGAGTAFIMRVPASASMMDVLLVDAGELVAIPRRRVVGVAMLEMVEEVGDGRVLWFRDAPVPLHDLSALLGFGPCKAEAAVVVEGAGRLAAWAVGGGARRQEIYVKELHPVLAGLPTVAGATLLADGRAVLVLDVDGVLHQTRSLACTP